MMITKVAFVAVLSLAFAHCAAAAGVCSTSLSSLKDETSHFNQRFVTVSENVKLEVLDWGGTGRPLVLLAGLGNSAHVFDDIAPVLAKHFHVYGITRRGFGASSVPASGYTPDRLADDIVAVLQTLKIERPILVGHSIAGEELSAVGNRHPELIAGVVYLDSIHEYAVYDAGRGGYLPDLRRVSEQVAQMQTDPLDAPHMKALLADVTALHKSLANELAAVETDHASAAGAAPARSGDEDTASFAVFRCVVSRQVGGLIPEDEIRQTFVEAANGGVGDQKAPDFVYNAILAGEDRLAAPKLPILAIVPVPRASDLPEGSDPSARKAADDMHTKMQEDEIATLQSQQPSATIVRIPHGHHYIFLSNPTDVVQAVNAFGDRIR